MFNTSTFCSCSRSSSLPGNSFDSSFSSRALSKSLGSRRRLWKVGTYVDAVGGRVGPIDKICFANMDNSPNPSPNCVAFLTIFWISISKILAEALNSLTPAGANARFMTFRNMLNRIDSDFYLLRGATTGRGCCPGTSSGRSASTEQCASPKCGEPNACA